jgi:hypothetical protein
MVEYDYVLLPASVSTGIDYVLDRWLLALVNAFEGESPTHIREIRRRTDYDRFLWRRGESNPCFLRRRPARSRTGLYPRGFRESKQVVEMPGWSWMLLVLLLGGERLERSGNRLGKSKEPP